MEMMKTIKITVFWLPAVMAFLSASVWIKRSPLRQHFTRRDTAVLPGSSLLRPLTVTWSYVLRVRRLDLAGKFINSINLPCNTVIIVQLLSTAVPGKSDLCYDQVKAWLCVVHCIQVGDCKGVKHLFGKKKKKKKKKIATVKLLRYNLDAGESWASFQIYLLILTRFCVLTASAMEKWLHLFTPASIDSAHPTYDAQGERRKATEFLDFLKVDFISAVTSQASDTCGRKHLQPITGLARQRAADLRSPEEPKRKSSSTLRSDGEAASTKRFIKSK